ncbi:hypothetical protein, partial [uncultured Nostoc sp.]|uniref:hypothetical protein n=1 Tax=uncultured Nostoc sp. TaxID=340711 RepID=UPI0035CBE8E4
RLTMPMHRLTMPMHRLTMSTHRLRMPMRSLALKTLLFYAKLYLVRWKDKPVALSIVQGWLIGLAHFTVGYILTYAAFLIASTASKFG